MRYSIHIQYMGRSIWFSIDGSAPVTSSSCRRIAVNVWGTCFFAVGVGMCRGSGSLSVQRAYSLYESVVCQVGERA